MLLVAASRRAHAMYSVQTTNGLGVTDGSGTINPAALNSSGMIFRIEKIQ